MAFALCSYSFSSIDFDVHHYGLSLQTPPRGLQLHLGTTTQPHLVDTLVMSNMGYFQLKASPGLWQLSIAPGRSRELYKMLSSSVQGGLHSGWSGVKDAGGAETLTDNSTQILLSSFLGAADCSWGRPV